MTATTAGVVQPPLRGPADLTRADIRMLITRTAVRFRNDDVPGMAAGVAFKIFLALFPTILAAGAVYRLWVPPAQAEEHIAAIASVLPPLAYRVVETNLNSLLNVEVGTAGSLVVVGLGAALFTATGAAATLIKALNRAHDITDLRPFLKQRLIGLAITAALLLSLLGLILLVVAGEPIQNWLLPERLQIPMVEIPLLAGRYVLALLLLIMLFGFTYGIGLNRVPPRWEWLSPGAVLGVVGWVVVAWGFRFYTVYIGGENYAGGGIYGTIGGVIVLLLWLQLSMLALLTGAEVNAVLDGLRHERWEARRRVLGADGVSSKEVPEDIMESTQRAEQESAGQSPPPSSSSNGHAPSLVPVEDLPEAPAHPPHGSRRAIAGIVASAALATLGVAGLVRRWLRSMRGGDLSA